MRASSVFQQSFAVRFDYPVIFTRGVFHPANPLLADTMDRLHENRRHRALVFIDSAVAAKHPLLPQRIKACFGAHRQRLDLVAPPRTVPGGESIKNNLSLNRDLIRRMLGNQLCRHSCVIVIGGGAVLDAVGFAASLVHRGLRLIRVPTTVLAQNDAGIGVKNGMNLSGKKNLIGTFAPPFAVLNDFDFLRTLSDRAWTDGIAEAFKVAIIRDAAFFRFLARNAAVLRARNEAAMERLVRRCAALHLNHIRTSGDPFEMGRARPLDFGHWSAHKLEALSRQRVSHGHAVAIGVALDSCYALHKKWLTAREFHAIHRGLTTAGFSLWHEQLKRRRADGAPVILDGLDDFREHLGGELCVTFPRGIGQAREIHEVDPALVEQCIGQLRRLAGPALSSV